jgi:hypothetical protein
VIVPGAPNPLLWGGVDPLDELGRIGNSVRYRSAAGGKLLRTPGANGNLSTWTWSGWMKRSGIAGSQLLFGAHVGAIRTQVILQSDGTFGYRWNSSSTTVASVGVLRDTSGWQHVVLVANGATLTGHVNGQQLWQVAIAGNGQVNSSAAIHEMCQDDQTGTESFDGYLADVHFVDGQALAPTAFGTFHPRTGQWRPKAYSGTYGTNGFHLDFFDGSAATSAALGKDRSGNNNDWTPYNISVAAGATQDWLLDSPTANFATFASLDPIQNALTVTNGGLQLNSNGSASSLTRRAPFSLSSGVWQWEITQTAGGNDAQRTGVVKEGASLLVASEVGSDAFGWGYQWSNGNKINAGSSTAYGATATTNDVIGVVFDANAGTLAFYKNGVSQGVAFSGLTSGPYYPAVSLNSTTHVLSANFGQRPFAYPVAGAKPVSTKDLRYPSIQKSESGFVARTNSGANIQATLAAAAPWSDWIRIYKRRDAAEGWRWQFSDDQANIIDSASTAAKVAFPALGGTSYVGYALKVSAANGIATGRVTHVNGVADVVADGLSNSRKMIILKNEAIGSWFVYHPELTAGKLLYLEQMAAEATDATIGTVLSNSFTVAAALASGTYRWISLAEVAGFLKLGKYIGNASTDGPFSATQSSPGWMFFKNASTAATGWEMFDAARSPANAADKVIEPYSPNAESTIARLDLVSNGIKLRNAGSTGNGSGALLVFAEIAAFPFRYANAR